MKRRAPDPDQLDLDGLYVVPQPPAPVDGSLDCAAELCATLSLAIDRARVEYGISRELIAARIANLTGTTVTVAMLNAWTSRSHDRHRFPFELAAAFEVATECNDLQLFLARRRGSLVLVGKAARDAKVGQIRRKMAELRDEERRLMRGKA